MLSQPVELAVKNRTSVVFRLMQRLRTILAFLGTIRGSGSLPNPALVLPRLEMEKAFVR